MKPTINKTKFVCLILLITLMVTGCTAAWIAGGAAFGAATYAYIQGELEAKYLTDFDTAWQASITGLEELQFEILNTTNDQLSGKIEARRSDGTPLRVKVEVISPRIVEVKVRVGLFGDKVVSERIQATIEKHIPPPPRRD